jgi:hypothetical protein
VDSPLSLSAVRRVTQHRSSFPEQQHQGPVDDRILSDG